MPQVYINPKETGDPANPMPDTTVSAAEFNEIISAINANFYLLNSSFDSTALVSGDTLPVHNSPAWLFAGIGTFNKPEGGTIVTTNPFNIIGTNGFVYSLITSIPITLTDYYTKTQVDAIGSQIVDLIFTKGDFVTEVVSNFAVGAINRGGSTASTGAATSYKRTSITAASGMFLNDPNKLFYYSGTIDNASYCGVAFYTSSFTFISSTMIELRTYTDEPILNIPTNCAYIGSCSLTNNPVIRSKTYTNAVVSNTNNVKKLNGDVYSIVQSVAAFAPGALTKTGNVNNSATTYRRTSNANINMFKAVPGRVHFYTGQIDSTSFAGVCYYTSDFTFISYEAGNILTYNRLQLTVPENTIYIGACSLTVDPIIEVEMPSSLDSSKNIIHINGAVSVTGDGTLAKPFKTIAEAFASRYSGNVEYLIYAGDYRETLQTAALLDGNFKIVGKETQKVRILGSNQLTGWALTTGQTDVWEIPFSTTFNSFFLRQAATSVLGGAMIFEDGNPSKPIEGRHAHPLQKNLSYRLPFTPMFPVATIAEVAATPGRFTVISGVMYLRPSSGNPNSNGFKYELPIRPANTVISAASQTKITSLVMRNIQFSYLYSGFRSGGFESVTRYNCTAHAISQDGAWENRSGYVETWYEEAGFCENDGENNHFSTAYPAYATFSDNRSNYPTCVHNYLWSHDNADDGESSHEQNNTAINKSLIEFNGDSGCRPSNDATYYVTNSIFRNNGWQVTNNGANKAPANGGEGISVCNLALNPARTGCRAVVMNNLFEENNVGIAAINQAGNYIVAIDNISRNNNTEIYANSGATVYLQDHKYENADPAKVKATATGGIITVAAPLTVLT